MEHKIKIWPQYYARVADGSKTFEVRNNDRGYQPGDIVHLNEFDPHRTYEIDHDRRSGVPGMTNYGTEIVKGEFTRSPVLTFKIGYVLPIDAERVVFSLLPVKEAIK